MKKLSRILCIILAFALCFSIVACGDSDGKKYSTDDKGRYYLDDDGVKVYKLVMMDHGVPSTTADKDKKYRQQVLNKINEKLYEDLGYKIDVEVNVYSDDTFADKLATNLADGNQLDLVRQTAKANLDSYVEQGIAKNLDKYLTAEYKANFSEKLLKEVMYDGSVYAIPLDKLPVNEVAYIRGDLLQKAGYTSLETIADWEDFMQKVIDGGTDYLDTKLVSVPLMGLYTTLEKMFLPNFTDTPGTFFDNEGNMLPVYFNDGYKQFVLKMRDWMEKGYIDNNIFNFSEFSMGTYFSNQTTAAVACGIYHLEFGSLLSVNKAHPEWNIKAALPTTGTNGKYSTECLMGEYVFMPYCAKSPGVAIDVINWMLFNEENYMLTRSGIEGLTYTLDENNVIDLPESEKTTNVTTPVDLIGRFTVGTSVKQNMGYPSATCPEGAKEAYKNSLKITDDELYVDPYLYVSSTLNATELAKLASANSDAIKAIQVMLTYKNGNFNVTDSEFDDEWADMLADYTSSAGSIYEKLTNEYAKLG